MKRKNPVWKRLAALALMLCVALACCCPAFAADSASNPAVTKDTTGIIQVKIVYKDENGVFNDVQAGTGFLINNNTVVTCDHVVTVSAETLSQAASKFGKTEKEIKDRLVIEVSVVRDVTIKASVKNESAEMDYAILTLETQLYDRTYLPIRSSSTVQQTEGVYALGFPGEVMRFQDVNTYTSDDVTITSGQVNKRNTINGVDYIQSSAKITEGNSGGPLVDANGNVIGICQGATGTGFESDYFYAIAVDQLTKTLTALGIDYTKSDGAAGAATTAAAAAGGTTTAAAAETAATTAAPADKSQLSSAVTEAQKLSLKDYSDETASAFESALKNAQDVLKSESATQAQVTAAMKQLNDAQLGLQKKSGLPMTYILIGIAALAVIVIVILILIFSKKKNGSAPKSNEYVPVGAPAGGRPVQGGFANQPLQPADQSFGGGYSGGGETSTLNAGAGETTVLSAGAGETTVLSQNQPSMGRLIRAKNGAEIPLTGAAFIIGKERSKVSYCISDNNSVSRTHARFSSHGGAVYVTDMNATNGTFLNGIRVGAGQESVLHDGDKITLADEEFTFHTN